MNPTPPLLRPGTATLSLPDRPRTSSRPMRTAFWTSQARPRGKAWVGALLFLFGILLGAGGVIMAPRFGIKVPLPFDISPAPELPKETKLKGKEQMDIELRKMANDVKKAQEKIKGEENELKLEKEKIEQEKTALDALKAKIDSAQAQLVSMAAQRDEMDQTNTQKLAKIWSQMEPEEVFQIAKGLDETFTAKVLYAMNPRQSAPIIAGFAQNGADGERLAAGVTKKLRSFRQPGTPDANAKPSGAKP